MENMLIIPNWVNGFLKFNLNNPINRIAYTEDDIKYKCMIIKKMQEIGMKITIDLIGNICGTIEGKEPESTILAMCSHTDSVPDGGQYDGPVGVLSALAIVEGLAKQKIVFKNNIKVIICACEESSRFNIACLGSKYLCGKLNKDEFITIKDKNEITLQDAIVQSKEFMKKHMDEYDIKGILETDFVISKEECINAIEIHIEQYESLYNSGNEIGIINSIVAPYRLQIDINGQAGHSGSAPMEERRDAVLAGAFFVTAINNMALNPSSNLRATVTRFETDKKYSMNKICDKVTMAVDIRMQYPNNVVKIRDNIHNIIKEVEKKTRTKFDISELCSENPIKTSDNLMEKLFTSSQGLGLKAIEMKSWAGHDIAYLPAHNRGLIFIPSTGGSHNCKENTTFNDISNGINVLWFMLQEVFKNKEIKEPNH